MEKQTLREVCMKRIAVFFPGIGYTVDKPLLYYSKKLMRERGYEIVDIGYKDISKDCLRDKSLMADTFAEVFAQTEEQLRDVDFASYEDVVFISKSVGTVAAAKYAADHVVRARHVFYTPLEQTFDYAGEGTEIVFFGDHDPWIVFERIKELCKSHDFRYTVIPDGNHSLETGRTFEDTDNIRKVIREVGEYLK